MNLFKTYADEIEVLCTKWISDEKSALVGNRNVTSSQIYNLMTFNLENLSTEDGIKRLIALLQYDTYDNLRVRLEDLYAGVVMRYGRFACWLNYCNFKYVLYHGYGVPTKIGKLLYTRYRFIWLIPTLQRIFCTGSRGSFRRSIRSRK